jgi:hypothetical protein
MNAIPRLTRRSLLLAVALAATLLAVWFAPEEADERSVVGPSADERRAAGGAPASPPPAAGEISEEDRRQALAALDVNLIRQRDGGAAATDVFSRRSWGVTAPPPAPAPPPPPPVAAPEPPPPPPPEAPPLPFKHLGRMVEAGRAKPVHYLMDGDRMLIVSEGDVIGGKYRFVGQIGNQLQFIYLPLDVRQNLPISGAQ